MNMLFGDRGLVSISRFLRFFVGIEVIFKKLGKILQTAFDLWQHFVAFRLVEPFASQTSANRR